MSRIDPQLTELLFRALDEPIGLAVTTNDPERLRQKLYAARNGEEELKQLTFSPSPFDPLGELWVYMKEHGKKP